MGLRLKTTLLLIALVVPLTTGFSIYRGAYERRAAHERRIDRLATQFSLRFDRRRPNAKRCVPPRFQQRTKRRNLIVRAYTHDYQPTTVDDPELELELITKLQQNKELYEPVHHWYWGDSKYLGATAVRVDDNASKCAILWLGWEKRRGAADWVVTRNVLIQSMVLAFMLLITGLVLTLPLVRRIRKLTEAVQRAPDNEWKIDEEIESTDEVGELARAFSQTGQRVSDTIEQLQERDRALSQYVSNTTHDLAIPLTVLQHRLRAMQDTLQKDQPVLMDDVHTALEESHYIASLIANMSAAAKLEAGEAHTKLHELDLCELVERIAARHTPIAAQKNIELNYATPSEDVLIQGDSTLLEQAISNLVQNAVQYHDKESGHVSIVVESWLSEGHRHFELKVLDDGPGVPRAFLGMLTQREARGDDARNRNPGGQGFGLSIANRVCELHGFELHFENGPEGGLIATIKG